MRKTKNTEAKLAVAQVYLVADQDYKYAEAKRGRCRDLVLVALSKGESIGPLTAEFGPLWLTHGEKERVEMDAVALSGMMVGIANYCTVNVAKLKADHPRIYKKMLRHKSTKRTAYSCLTWSEKAPAPKRRPKR